MKPEPEQPARSDAARDGLAALAMFVLAGILIAVVIHHFAQR